jgi:ethanolamine utilization protein EutN
MKLGKVIGRVVSTKKLECFEGFKMLLLHRIDENGKELGDPIVAFDTAQAGEGDTVFYETSKEAGFALQSFNPADAAILGVVDSVEGGG